MNLNQLAEQIYQNNKAQGFWDKERNFGEFIALVHSELSEALECHRKNKPKANTSNFYDEHITLKGLSYKKTFETDIKDTVEDELADTIIRVLDYCGANNIDIDWHVKAKIHYNTLREYKHGKQY